MTLRERMVYPGIRTSRRLARLTWFQRDFFHGLILVADDFGRFEADAEMLRTVLFAPCLQKVSGRDVQGALVACHEAGLVKLYQSGARGYGKVQNFRQKLRERRALYPDEEEPPPEQDLFGGGLDHLLPAPTAPTPPTPLPLPPPIPPINTEGRKEGRNTPPAQAAPETQPAWLARLQAEHPHLDVPAQLKLAKTYCDKQRKKLDRIYFERWLANTGAEVAFDAPGAAPAPLEPEPEAWRAYLKDRYDGETWADTAALYPWPQLPANWRAKIAREMGRTG